MNRTTRSICSFLAVLCMALFASANASPPSHAPISKVFAPDTASNAVTVQFDLIDHAFAVDLAVEIQAEQYAVAEHAVALAAPNIQPKASGHARTCGHADSVALYRRSQLSTYYEQRS